jgi:hypothetical protein
MAFQVEHLEALNYADEFTSWVFHAIRYGEYRGAVKRAGYFDTAADKMQQGDLIHAICVGGAMSLVVAEVTNTTVRVVVMSEVEF